jgi:hypothetical protein
MWKLVNVPWNLKERTPVPQQEYALLLKVGGKAESTAVF